METMTLTHVSFDGSVAVCTALAEDGSTVRFGADWRAALTLQQLLQQADDDVLVGVEGWQILSRTA